MSVTETYSVVTEVSMPTEIHNDNDKVPTYFTLLLVVICILIFTGNSLVLCSVVRFSRLRTPTNMFLCALALSDLMVGIGRVCALADILGAHDRHNMNYVSCVIFIFIMNVPLQSTNLLVTGKILIFISQ